MVFEFKGKKYRLNAKGQIIYSILGVFGALMTFGVWAFALVMVYWFI